ncbi:MAG: metallophosphoesterase family protein [Candidatus Aminicenantia bacterium]
MKYLIFSDVHSNLEALRAVFNFIWKRKFDTFIFLGDIVGYGANPNEVIEEIRKLSPVYMVRGNHDKASSGLVNLDYFNPIAAHAVMWTLERLSKENQEFLKELKAGPLRVNDEMTICHGSPWDEDYYMFNKFDALEAFSVLESKICFFGHTHFPAIHILKGKEIKTIYPAKFPYRFKLEDGFRFLINPGSVGQPRDGNPLSSFLIYESSKKSITINRIPYDISTAQSKILNAGLPPMLANRLSSGV